MAIVFDDWIIFENFEEMSRCDSGVLFRQAVKNNQFPTLLMTHKRVWTLWSKDAQYEDMQS